MVRTALYRQSPTLQLPWDLNKHAPAHPFTPPHTFESHQAHHVHGPEPRLDAAAHPCLGGQPRQSVQRHVCCCRCGGTCRLLQTPPAASGPLGSGLHQSQHRRAKQPRRGIHGGQRSGPTSGRASTLCPGLRNHRLVNVVYAWRGVVSAVVAIVVVIGSGSGGGEGGPATAPATTSLGAGLDLCSSLVSDGRWQAHVTAQHGPPDAASNGTQPPGLRRRQRHHSGAAATAGCRRCGNQLLLHEHPQQGGELRANGLQQGGGLGEQQLLNELPHETIHMRRRRSNRSSRCGGGGSGGSAIIRLGIHQVLQVYCRPACTASDRPHRLVRGRGVGGCLGRHVADDGEDVAQHVAGGGPGRRGLRLVGVAIIT